MDKYANDCYHWYLFSGLFLILTTTWHVSLSSLMQLTRSLTTWLNSSSWPQLWPSMLKVFCFLQFRSDLLLEVFPECSAVIWVPSLWFLSPRLTSLLYSHDTEIGCSPILLSHWICLKAGLYLHNIWIPNN